MSGATRPLRQIVPGSDDVTHFRNVCLRYHVAQGGKKAADTYGCIDFSTMAADWNELIQQQDARKKPKTGITMKNAYLLKSYWEEKKRRDNTSFAVNRMGAANENSHVRVRHRRRADQQDYMDAAAPAMPAAPGGGGEGAGEGYRAGVPNVAGSAFSGESNLTDGRAKRKATKRCRTCGHDTFSDEWKRLHTFGGVFGGTGRVAECRVPEDEREDGFPVADGRLPKKKKESRGANSENQSK